MMISRPVLAALLGLVLTSSTLVGCGDPTTQVYVQNLDDVPYYLTYQSAEGPGERVDVFLPASDEGLLFSTPANVSGNVILRRVDCDVSSDTPVGPRRTLIVVQSGLMRVVADADLSSRLGSALEGASDCVGASAE